MIATSSHLPDPAMTPVRRLRARCAGQPMVVEGVAVDLVHDLRDLILARASTMPSYPSNNRGGWRSDDKLLSWDVPCMHALREALCGQVGSGEPIGWAIVNRRGSRHLRHRHASIVSGVLYIDPGDDTAACPTIFELVDGTQVAVAAVSGRLVMFPGDMKHWVAPYWGERPRITVAFDLRQ